MTRYTPKKLHEDIEKINEWLEDCKSTKRIECGGRNGYQAVDQYSVDESGKRLGSWVDRNIRCGTSRECHEAALEFYHAEYSNKRDASLTHSK